MSLFARLRNWALGKFGYNHPDQRERTASTTAALAMTDIAEKVQKRTLAEQASVIDEVRNILKQPTVADGYPIEQALFPRERAR